MKNLEVPVSSLYIRRGDFGGSLTPSCSIYPDRKTAPALAAFGTD